MFYKITLCLGASAESNPKSSQAKIWSVKSFLSKKNPPTQCILHNLVHCGVSAD